MFGLVNETEIRSIMQKVENRTIEKNYKTIF